MSNELEEAILSRLSANGPQATTKLLDFSKAACGCSRASFYRELKRLEDGGALLVLNSTVQLHPAYFVERKVKQAELEDAAFRHGDRILLDVKGGSQSWVADTLPRVHALWSSIALTILNSLPGAAYVGWSPHPWFQLSSENLEDQALTAHFAGKHAFTTIIGPSGKLGEQYLDYFKARGGVVRRVRCTPDNLQGVHLSVIEDFVIKIRLDADLKNYLEKLFAADPLRTQISNQEANELQTLKGVHLVELEKNAEKAEKILALLLSASAPD